MDFLKNAFNRGLDIGSLGVKKGINFLGKLAGNHYENGGRVTSKNWNGNDKFVKDGNIQKRTVNRQKSNIMAARAEVFGFLKETVNDNSVNPELVNAGRILLENYDILNDNCINDLHRRLTECINNRDNQQLINEFEKYIVDIASRAEREKVFLFLEQNKNKNNLRKDILENIHALLHDRDLIDKEAIGPLYSAITSNNDTAITREITTAASRIKSQIILSFLEQHKNNNNLRKDILENIHALLHDRNLIDKEAISSLYSAITSNNDTAIQGITTAASRIKSQRIVSFLEQHKNNNNLRKDILENIHALLHDRNLIDKETINSLYSAITSNNDTAIIQEITTAASRIKPRIVEIKLVKIVPNLKDKDEEYDVNPKNNLSTINNINIEDTDIEPSGDSVFHIAEAIIANAAKLDDKKLMSNEKEFTANEIESELRSFVGLAKLMFKNTPLGALDILKVESTALKRVNTKLLAKVCTDAFNKIKDNKDIKKCVNDLSNALIRYSKSETFEDCKKIILIQEKLREAIKNYNHIESVNEVLNTVFIRAAVDKFYKNFGDLSNPNAISRLKSIFNSLYEKIWDVPEKEKSLAINLNTHLKNLIYGFGFYPSSVDIGLKNLAGEDVGTTGVLSALKALSKEHALTIKNGKKFEIVNTGSYNDRNCAFRAIAIGAGFGPNGYNIVQQKVVEGAQKLLEMWDSLDYVRKDQIARMLGGRVGTSYNLSDVKKLLKEYIDCRGQGFVSGMQHIECLFAAICLGRPICVSDNQFGKEYAFLPDGKKEDMIRDDYSTFGKPVYVGFISGHAEALLPLDNKGSQKMADKLPELRKKASEMKNTITEHISGVIYGAINKQNSSLHKIIAQDPRRIGESFFEEILRDGKCKNDKNLFVAMKILAEVDSKLDADKRADAYNLEKEIMTLFREKVTRNNENRRWFPSQWFPSQWFPSQWFPSQEEVLQNKLKQFVDIFADKAVELCKKEPLFWDNVNNSIFRLW